MTKILGFGRGAYQANWITDEKDTNNFGVLLHTQEAIRGFQLNSGMGDDHSVEYQHHYIAATARLTDGDSIFDIAIPLVLFNYKQKVSAASVDFHLNDVNDIQNQLFEVAKEKFAEFEATDTFKQIEDLGVESWDINGMHNIHKHPGGLSSFSGTDYSKNPNDAGICFPLSEGKDLPIFSSIILHSGEGKSAKICHTEYRVFNGDGEDLREYKQGNCITLVRGQEGTEDLIVTPEVVEEPGYIKKLFGMSGKTIPAVVVKGEPTTQSYRLKNLLSGTEGDEIIEYLNEVWDKSDFTPSIEYIAEENITANTYFYNQYNKPAYGHTKQVDSPALIANKQPTFIQMKNAIIEGGYVKTSDILTYDLVSERYVKMKEAEAEEKAKAAFTPIVIPSDLPGYHIMRYRLIEDKVITDFEKLSYNEVRDLYIALTSLDGDQYQ